MKRYCFCILVVLLYFVSVVDLHSQLNKFGTPVFKNYSSQITGGSDQNWWITKDKFGSVYFANDEKGVIKYDGTTWSRIPIRKNGRVRSLASDNNGIIYVGGAYEFGYIEPDRDGNPSYVSLSDRYDPQESRSDSTNGSQESTTGQKEPELDFGEILAVCTLDSLVFFLSPAKFLFVYNNVTRDLKYLNIKDLGFNRFERIFNVYDRIILGDNLKGLHEYKDGKIVPLPNGSYFSEVFCLSILPYEKGKVVVGTYRNGAILYDYINGTVDENWVEKPVREKLSQIYCGARLSSGDFAFGTVSTGDGIYVLNKDGKLVGWWNSLRTDLQDNNIYALNSTDNGELWITTYGTISKAYINLPYYQFSTASGIESGANGICEMNGVIYLSTDNGVSRSRTDENGIRYFEPIEEIEDQVFPIMTAKVGNEKFVLAGALFDLYQIKPDGSISRIADKSIPSINAEGASYAVRYITQSEIDPRRFYFGSISSGVYVVDYINGEWIKVRKVPDILGTISRMLETENGDLIVVTEPPNGLYRIKLNDSLSTKYTTEDGLPNGNVAMVGKVNKEVVLSSANGLYKYLADTDSWVSFNEVAGGHSAGKFINFFYSDTDNDLWLDLNETRYSAMLLERSDSQIIAYKDNFQTFPNVAIMGASTIDGKVWLPMSKNVFVINKEILKLPSPRPITLFTKIIVGADSAVMQGSFYKTLEDGRRIPETSYSGLETPEIKFNLNSLSFYWTTPYFVEEESLLYSYKLEGLSNEWSRWEHIGYKDFMNLPFGKYTFRVKAKTVNLIESEEAVFEFIILKPWYLKAYMIILYIIVFILLILIIIRAYTKKLKNENIRLEGIVAERTAVVVKQKEELESSIHYARRIQMALLPSESILSENLSNYFILFKPRDIVSGDFYWMTKKNNRLYIVAADCTGHGVPGAFMSLLGMSFLDEIIDKEQSPSADYILGQLRLHVTESLKQSGGDDEAKDGMDLALLVIDFNTSRVEFSGAYNPCFRIRKMTEDEAKMHKDRNMELPDGSMTDGTYLLETIYASKMPIGISSRMNESFVFNDWDLAKGVSYYLFSDGYIDQFGGSNGRKFMKKNFKKLLLEIQHYSMKKQKEILDQNLRDWMGESPQIDDILVMGIRTE